MKNVIEVQFNHGQMADEAVQELEMDIVEALNHASECGVAQGIIVAILQGYLYRETQRMCGDIEQWQK